MKIRALRIGLALGLAALAMDLFAPATLRAQPAPAPSGPVPVILPPDSTRPRPSVAPRPAVTPRPAVPRTPAQVLVEANNQYAYGAYAKVVSLLRPLVERDLFGDEVARLGALRIYGICLYLTGRKAAARRVFGVLLKLAPKTRLDPRVVQPEVVAAFDGLRRQALMTVGLRLRKRAQEKLASRFGVLNFLPSAGQFQNGQWKKAVTLISLELAFLIANISSYYLLKDRDLRQPDGTFIEKDASGVVVKDHRGLARALMGVNYTSLGLLLGTLVYGIIDGWIYWAKERRRLKAIVERPLTVSPFVAQSGGGVALSLRFD